MKTYKKPFVKIVDTKGQVILAGSDKMNKATGDIDGSDVGSKRNIFDYSE